MMEPRFSQDGLERIEAAKRKYVEARRRLDDLRDTPPLAAPAGSHTGLDEANRHVKEAFAEWVMLFEHETGHKLTSLLLPITAE